MKNLNYSVYISNLGSKENYYIYLTNIEKNTDILTISIEEPEKELYWKKDLNEEIIKGITLSLGEQISLIKFYKLIINSINQSVSDENDTLNIYFKSLNEIKGILNNNFLLKDDIKKYLIIDIVNKNISYPIQLEFFGNKPKEDLLWKTIRRLKNEKKNDSFSELINIQKENFSLKKSIEMIGNFRQLGAVENDSYKIKYEKLMEEFNLYKKKHEKKKKDIDFEFNNLNICENENKNFFVTKLVDNFMPLEKDNEIQDRNLKIDEKKKEDNNEFYEYFIRILRNEIINLKTNIKNLKAKIIKLEMKNPLYITNGYNNHYKNNINFLSHRINNFYKINNDKIPSKTSPIKEKINKTMLYSNSEKRKNLFIKKIYNKNPNFNNFINKKQNENYINNLKYRNISNSHFGIFPIIYNKRMLNKKNFQLKRNNSTFENSSTSHMKNSLFELYNPLIINSDCPKILNNKSLNEIKLKPFKKKKKKIYHK